jgi:ribose transport system permease protein
VSVMARTASSQRGRASEWVGKRRDLVVVYFVLGVMIAVGSAFTPNFLSAFNIQSIVAGAAALAFVSIGQTFVVLTGGIDLSVGSIMSLITVVAATHMQGSDDRILSAAALSIGIGAGLGLVNGLAVTVLRLEPIIATLGMLSVIQGLTFLRSMEPAGLTAPFLQGLIYDEVGPIPKALFLILGAFILGLFVLRKTRYGMHVYALGGSEQAARLSGVATIRVKLSVYVLSGVFAAMAGLLLAGRLGQGDPLSGQVFMLTSVAVVTIGGTSLFGGRGGLAGTLAGVFILTILANVLNLEGIQTYPQQLTLGLLIIAVVALYSATRLGLPRSRLPYRGRAKGI